MKLILAYPSEQDIRIAESFLGYVDKHVGDYHATLWYTEKKIEIGALKFLCALFLNCRYAVHEIKGSKNV